MKNDQKAAAAGEVDPRGWRVIKDFIGAGHGVQSLNHLSGIRVDDHKLARIDYVSASQPAAHEEAMVSRIQTRRVRLRASGDGPFGNDGAFIGVDNLDDTLAIHDVTQTDVQPICRTIEDNSRGIAGIELNAAHQFGRLRVYDFYRAVFISLPGDDADVIQPLDRIVGRLFWISIVAPFSTA